MAIKIIESGPRQGCIDHEQMTIADLQTIYLDWVNNFLTLEKFAEHYGMTVLQAHATMVLGRQVHDGYAEWCQAMGVHQ